MWEVLRSDEIVWLQESLGCTSHNLASYFKQIEILMWAHVSYKDYLEEIYINCLVLYIFINHELVLR